MPFLTLAIGGAIMGAVVFLVWRSKKRGVLTATTVALPKAQSGLSCSQATDEKNAFQTYQFVRSQLKSGHKVEQIEYLECFLDKSTCPEDPKAALQVFEKTVFQPNVLYSYLAQELDQTLKTDEASRAQGKGGPAWRYMPLGQAALRAYDHTGEDRFLELYVSSFERLMAIRDNQLGLFDDFHKKQMNSWGNDNLNRRRWVSHVTHFSVIMLPATAIARRIKEHSGLEKHLDYANRVIEYFEQAYPEFDTDYVQVSGTEERWFWRPLKGKFEATNHLHLQGQVLLNVYAITGKEQYRERITAILDIFSKGAKIDANGMARWRYDPYFQVEAALSAHNSVEEAEFVWKAGLTIPFLYQAHADGFAVDPALLRGVTKSIVDHVLANGGFATNIHPYKTIVYSRKQQAKTHARYVKETEKITRFLAAAPESAAIPKMIFDTVTGRPDLFRGGWFRSPDMALGYSFYLGEKGK